MLIAKVIGTTVSTIRTKNYPGRKLLIVRQTDEKGERWVTLVADRHVDAGVGDSGIDRGWIQRTADEHHQGHTGGRGIMAMIRYTRSRRQNHFPQVSRI